MHWTSRGFGKKSNLESSWEYAEVGSWQCSARVEQRTRAQCVAQLERDILWPTKIPGAWNCDMKQQFWECMYALLTPQLRGNFEDPGSYREYPNPWPKQQNCWTGLHGKSWKCPRWPFLRKNPFGNISETGCFSTLGLWLGRLGKEPILLGFDHINKDWSFKSISWLTLHFDLKISFGMKILTRSDA